MLRAALSLLFVLALILPSKADNIYIMNAPGYNTCQPTLVTAIQANGHTVTNNTTTYQNWPGIVPACVDPVNGYDWLCFFGNFNYAPMLPQIQAFIDGGGKVFYQYEVSCCVTSSTSAANIISGLTPNAVTPNANAYIGLSGAANVPGWEAADIGCCVTIVGNAYKGLDGLPVANQLQATGDLNGGNPTYTTCTNFGFVFTTGDFSSGANQGAIVGMGDMNAWYDSGEPTGPNPVNAALVDFFFPNANSPCYIIEPGCVINQVFSIATVDLGNDTTICGGSITLDATTNGATYLWSDASTNPTLNVSTAGTYWVEVTIGTCTVSDTIVISAGAATLNLGNDTTLCPGQSATYDATLAGAISYLWSDGSTNAQLTTSTPGTYYVDVDVGGCIASDTVVISASPLLDPTITPAGPFCLTDPAVTLTAVDPNGTWTGTGITNGATGDFDPATAGVGSHVITYSIPGACGGMDTETIVVTAQLDATITPAGPFCESNAPAILAAVDPNGTWTGTGITNGATGEFDPAVAGPGTWTITYTIPGGCGSTDTEDITVIADADATITPAGPFCIDNGAVFLAAVDPNGVWSGNGIIDPATGEFDPATAGPGTHAITYTIAGACGDVGTVNIQVYDPLTAAAFNDTTICEGGTATLTATGSGGDGNLTYTWTDGAANQVGTGTSLSVSPTANETYTVTITDGCATNPATATVTVTVEAIPGPMFIVDNATGCVAHTVNFTDQTVPAGTSCTWDFGDGNTGVNCGSATHTYTQAGCYDVTLTVTSAAGCVGSLTQPSMVCVFDQAVAGFTIEPQVTDVYDPVINFSNGNTGADTWVWTFGDGNSSTSSDPSHTYPTVPGVYEVCLTAENAAGCNDTICDSVYINDVFSVYVPNAFTPDLEDNINDVFLPIVYGEDPSEFEFFVFDRWGHIVFQSQDKNVGWDGSVKGYATNGKTDVYAWKLVLRDGISGEKRTYYGHVTLLK